MTVEKAITCLGKEDWNGAIANFNQALSVDSSMGIIYKPRSVAYFRKGDYDRTVEDCTKALSFNAVDRKAHFFVEITITELTLAGPVRIDGGALLAVLLPLLCFLRAPQLWFLTMAGILLEV